MKNHLTILAFLIGLCFASTGFTEPTAPTIWKGKADIMFSGSSTLHDWSGKVSAEPFQTKVTVNEQGEPQNIAAKVKVTAASMDTDEAKRDENMKAAMKVSEYPLIEGEFDAPYSVLYSDKDKTVKKLPFEISLLGKTHQVEGAVSEWKATDSKVEFAVDFDLSLKDCGITVPSVLLFIRVDDTIKVHVDVNLVRTPVTQK